MIANEQRRLVPTRRAAPEDIQLVRKLNLRALVALYGGPSRLADRIGYGGPSFVCQMTSGKKAITEKTIRKIEKELGLPYGWMDLY